MELSKEAQEDIIKFQQIQEQIQVLLMQKQNLQLQQAEIEAALKELEVSKEKDAFEVVGNVMIKKPVKEITGSLKEKKELIELRMSTLDKQAEKLSEKAKELQKKLASQLKHEKE